MLKMSHMIASQREAKPNNSDDEAQIKKTLLRYSRFLELIKPSKRPVFLGTGPRIELLLVTIFPLEEERATRIFVALFGVPKYGIWTHGVPHVCALMDGLIHKHFI